MKGKGLGTIGYRDGTRQRGWAQRLSAQDKYTVKVPVGSRSPSSGDTKTGRFSPLVRTEACWLRSSPIP